MQLSGATSAWSTWDLNIAVWRSGAWSKIVPKNGFKAWVRDERLTLTYKAWVRDERLTLTYEDGVWRDGIALTQNGGRVTLRAKEEELTLSGGFVETSATFIPSRAIVLAVASRTTQAITGATSYDVGISGEQSKFGGTLGIALGSTNIGVIGPTAFYADTRARVTANGSSFAGGKVRLIVYFLEMAAPIA